MSQRRLKPTPSNPGGKPPTKAAPQKADGFMDYVQLHERTWGTESYIGRPQLAELLQSPAVVFWHHLDQERFTVTLHNSLGEVEQYIAKVLLRSTLQPPKQRVVRVFVNQKHMRIKSVRIEFEQVD